MWAIAFYYNLYCYVWIIKRRKMKIPCFMRFFGPLATLQWQTILTNQCNTWFFTTKGNFLALWSLDSKYFVFLPILVHMNVCLTECQYSWKFTDTFISCTSLTYSTSYPHSIMLCVYKLGNCIEDFPIWLNSLNSRSRSHVLKITNLFKKQS